MFAQAGDVKEKKWKREKEEGQSERKRLLENSYNMPPWNMNRQRKEINEFMWKYISAPWRDSTQGVAARGWCVGAELPFPFPYTQYCTQY